MSITAVARLNEIRPVSEDQTQLIFGAAYGDHEENKEWAKWTPVLQIFMVVRDEVLPQFGDIGTEYLLTFDKR